MVALTTMLPPCEEARSIAPALMASSLTSSEGVNGRLRCLTSSLPPLVTRLDLSLSKVSVLVLVIVLGPVARVTASALGHSCQVIGGTSYLLPPGGREGLRP